MNLTQFEIIAVVTAILVAVSITLILYRKEKEKIASYMESVDREIDSIQAEKDRAEGIETQLLSSFPIGRELEFLGKRMIVTGVRSVNMNCLPSLIADYVGNDGQIRQYAFSEILPQACFDYRPYEYTGITQ